MPAERTLPAAATALLSWRLLSLRVGRTWRTPSAMTGMRLRRMDFPREQSARSRTSLP